MKGKDKKQVSFELDIHNTTETHLSLHDVDPVEKRLTNIASGIKVNQINSKVNSLISLYF